LKTKLVAIAAAAVAILPLTSSPATAGPGHGKIAFSCVADLPAFPSAASNGTCGSGTLGTGPVVPSSASGKISGLTDQGNAFTVAVAGTNNFNAEFAYREPCVAGEPPVTGEANGTATVTGWTGRVVDPDTGAVEIVTNGTLTVTFNWARVGATAEILIGDADLSFTGSSDTATNGTGAGGASFAPVLTQGNLCPEGGPLKALVTGSAALAWTP
jgi:hypothetical protein